MKSRIVGFLISFQLSVILAACGGVDASTESAGKAKFNVNPVPAIGPSCASKNPDQICLGLKYVAYSNWDGQPVMTQEEMISGIKAINEVWGQCRIQFQIDEYIPSDPNKAGLRYSPADFNELWDIRKAYDEDSSLLVAITGRWDRTGSLGNTGANAWTAMPGESAYGVILEQSVGNFPNIIAHELGHYVGLDHADSTTYLMNPIIHDYSTNLSDSECAYARETIHSYWQRMMR